MRLHRDRPTGGVTTEEGRGKMRNVFVYGTLRANEINDIGRAAARHRIEAPRLIGSTTVRGRLYDFGAYPGLVPDASQGPVLGDVYEVHEALVPVLDEIEEVYPGVDGLFKSRELTVVVDGRRMTCLFYPVEVESVAGLPQIEDGDWVEYRLARDAEPVLEQGDRCGRPERSAAIREPDCRASFPQSAS
jgi:gamma-glutamylcyclotransferase (GGCT)/AIG2-like uncharacterized protein YtfP